MLIENEVQEFVDDFNNSNANAVKLVDVTGDKMIVEFSNDTITDLFKDRISDVMKKTTFALPITTSPLP